MSVSQNPWKAFSLAYITIEMESAFIIGASGSDNLFDAVFVTDANGLPCVPGESLAGVLRHALAGEDGPSKDSLCCELFGYQRAGGGASSRVRLSFAHAHNQNDSPVPFRGAKLSGDPVLSALIGGVGRDHVRIGGNGAAENRGKFDELLIPAGARFTFEICLSEEAKVDITRLVAVLTRPEVRLGGKTRSGLGRFKVVKAKSARFDLAQKPDLENLGRLPVALEEAYNSPLLKEIDIPEPSRSSRFLEVRLRLKPLGTWMVGGGTPTGREPTRSKEEPWDRVPLSEPRISWRNGIGEVHERERAPYLLPASSVKGAIRHRTAFHARRLQRLWMKDGGGDAVEEEAFLFGDVRAGDSGEPGLVMISDVYLPSDTRLQALQHVSLDRFTQGPMDHMLYDELALAECELRLDITINRKCTENKVAAEALQCALNDLCRGRLALGAGRGHGRFGGSLVWQSEETLLKEVAQC